MGDIPDFSNPAESEKYKSGVAEYTEYMKKLAENNEPIHGVLEYSALKVKA